MKKESRQELMLRIQELSFACVDLNLYLDNHPEDKNAINTYNKLVTQFVQARCAYESKYGPLLLSSNALNTYPWAWNNSPWPWESK